MKRFFLVISLGLTACAAPDAPRTPRPAPPMAQAAAVPQCGADLWAGLVGQKGTALERVYILGQVRVLRPGQRPDGTVRPQRLSFEIDPQGRISRVFCG